MQHSSEDSIRNRNCSISKGRALSTPDVYASPLHQLLGMIRIPAAVSPPLHTLHTKISLSQLGNGWWIIMLSVHAQRQPRNATSTRSLKLPMPEAKNCAHSQLPFILLLWGGPSIPSAE
ncbi:hypothetical protein An02g05290 [Aspergillus niger]|uniref:Uncharacterized protein n=2 Tax=Aspergillus niger TaxID=5061 RepID=A2QCZ5_ASPNC|nr:hypothetical protein An02g05290 [Aspergillus niger]CAK37635.1 hypothetical protein An02g05290 [Aspergillus niger]